MTVVDLVVGATYSRDQLADVIDYPAAKRGGGEFTTGYFEHAGAYFLLCNVGVAGRTGHDYPNRWDGKLLVWSAKSGRGLYSSQVADMVGGRQPIHVFWRAKDRAPFTYAGEARAVEVFDEPTARVIWSFETAASAPADDAVIEFAKGAATTDGRGSRRGPPPAAGERTSVIRAGEAFLYVMRLDDPAGALFPGLAADKAVIKIGYSNAPSRRIRELNFGFPPKCAARWLLEATKRFASDAEAFAAEGALLESIRLRGDAIGGEFAMVERSTIADLLSG